jgi:hypothetical protein
MISLVRKVFVIFLISILLTSSVVALNNNISDINNEYQPSICHGESFETGFGGWIPDNHTITPWVLRRTHLIGNIGTSSIEIAIDGSQDDGTVWIEKPIIVPQNSRIKIDVTFFVFSSMPSEVNMWGVLAYAGTLNPEVEHDFTRVGYTNPVQVKRWADYNYSTEIYTESNNIIWVATGISVYWETWRNYYIDDIFVTIEIIDNSGLDNIVNNNINNDYQNKENAVENPINNNHKDFFSDLYLNNLIIILCFTGFICLTIYTREKRKHNRK